MALGPRDTGQLVLHPGWDATALQNHRLQDGTTFAAIVAQMSAALGALNAELGSDPLWASMVSYSDEPTVEYRVGASNGFEFHTEYGRPDSKRADTIGHMLPLVPYDRMLGWTWDYLRKARLPQVQADIADGIKDARDRWRLSILGRVLSRTDDTGASKGLGTSGESPGFATAAASTAVDFTPPAFGGTSFDSNHEHYVGITGGVFTNAVFEDAYDELREHGHEPPFDFLIGTADRVAVEALTKFIPAGDALIRYGTTQDIANVDMGYIGVIENFRVREVRGIPQYYGFGFKSYGPNSQRNPLRILLQKGTTSPTVTAFPDPRSGSGPVYPLQNLMLFMEFGVGVGDRTAGTPRYVNSATWSNGVAT